MSISASDVAHQTPGRVRIKVKRGKRNPELLRATAEAMKAIPGVERVETNEVTGSVVLFYDVDRHDLFQDHFQRSHEPPEPVKRAAPRTEFDTIAETIETEAEFLAEHSVAARALLDFTRDLDRQIKISTGNNVDLKLIFAGGVVLATVVEIGATAATPVWVTLSLFAMNHFVELHQKSAVSAPARAMSRA